MRQRSIIVATLILLSIAIQPGLHFNNPAAAQTKGEAVKFAFLPGKSVGMKPPSGFRRSGTFAGFEYLETGSSFLFAEFPAQAYRQMSDGMTKTALAGQGITVNSRKPVSINGVEGLLISGTQTLNGQAFDKWLLLLGSKSVAVMVSAQGLSGTSLNNKNVMAAFNSIRIRAPQGLDEQLAELPFSIGTLAGFRIIRTVTGNGVLLTKGPKDVIADASQPVVIVVRPIAAEYPTNVAPAALSEQMLRTVKSVTITSIGKSRKTSVAGADGHELNGVAKHTASGEQVRVFQWLRLESGKQIRVLAILAVDQTTALLPELRKLAANLRIR